MPILAMLYLSVKSSRYFGWTVAPIMWLSKVRDILR